MGKVFAVHKRWGWELQTTVNGTLTGLLIDVEPRSLALLPQFVEFDPSP